MQALHALHLHQGLHLVVRQAAEPQQLEEQAARTADSVLELLHLASRKDVSRLDARIAELEQRLEALSQGAR